jgi:hypothetical protein
LSPTATPTQTKDPDCDVVVTEFNPSALTACRYNQPESARWLHFNFNCGFDELISTTIIISSFKVNGVEYVSGPSFSTTIDASNVNFVPAINNVATNCNLPYTTGRTYTNFYDLLNNVIGVLSIPNISVQLSYTQSNFIKEDTFYLIYQQGDTFDVTVSCSSNFPFIFHYTNTGVFDNSNVPVGQYLNSECNVPVTGGAVIE